MLKVYQQGLRNMNLKFIMFELCLPVLVCLGLILAVPHVIAKSVVPALGNEYLFCARVKFECTSCILTWLALKARYTKLRGK